MEYDAETGFYHTAFRYYQPKLGSWTSPDPAGMGAADASNPQSLNRYAYVLNNPINFFDPLGLGCWTYDEEPCTDCSIAPCVIGKVPGGQGGGGGGGGGGSNGGGGSGRQEGMKPTSEKP